jgi:hypothetical protein
MKTNHLLLSVFFLFFLFGCNNIVPDIKIEIPEVIPDDEVTPPDNPDVEIGIPSLESTIPSILIEYLDKEKKGYLLLEGEELTARQNDLMDVEFLSFIDETTGLSFIEQQEARVIRNMFGYGPEVFEYYDKQETIRHYIFKYKVPSIKGESTEEIKCIYHYYGGYGKYTEVWYNGKVIPIMDKEEINERYPPEGSNDRYDKDVYERIMKETYYSGDLVAITTASEIYIVIPVEKP